VASVNASIDQPGEQRFQPREASSRAILRISVKALLVTYLHFRF